LAQIVNGTKLFLVLIIFCPLFSERSIYLKKNFNSTIQTDNIFTALGEQVRE
jgi:hypothetical protein